MLGRKSSIAKQLTWHCLILRLELAVGDTVLTIFKHFWTNYTLCIVDPPQNQLELKECTAELQQVKVKWRKIVCVEHEMSCQFFSQCQLFGIILSHYVLTLALQTDETIDH